MSTIEPNAKKVLFLICASHPKAGGGHFYSLSTLMEALQESVEAKVINIGMVKVNTLPEQDVLGFVPIFKYSILFYFTSLLKLVKEFRPDVLHAFDERSLYVSKLLSLFIKLPVIYTKCGGVNGGKNIPFADTSIFFSIENQRHYLKYRKFNGEHYLIPNRSLPVQEDANRKKLLLDEIGQFEGVTILRVSRFNRYYELTFKQSLQLLQDFEESGQKARLVFIGKVQDVVFHQQLKSGIKKSNVLFVTDDRLTRDASKLLGVADVVVGTGRGVMEAASLSKPVYCPNGASIRPVFLCQKRIIPLLAKNFSERYREEGAEAEVRIDSEESNEAFRQYFDIRSVISKYEEIYNNVRLEKRSFRDWLIGSLWFFRL